MKKHVQVKDSYNTWKPSTMKKDISEGKINSRFKDVDLDLEEEDEN